MIDNEKIEHMYSPSNPAIIAVLMAFLLLIIVITAVMVARHVSLHHFMIKLYLLTPEKYLTLTLKSRYFNRHKGEYVTREDEGAADAFDADTAVLQGKTGHHVEKKKEWFI